MEELLVLLFLIELIRPVLIGGLYFLPTIMVAVLQRRGGCGIFMLNLFLGWTILGWVIALIWAFVSDGVDDKE